MIKNKNSFAEKISPVFVSPKKVFIDNLMCDASCRIVETATGKVIKPFGVTITKT